MKNMFDMLVEQSSRVSPLTPVSSPPGSHLHHHLNHPSHLSPHTSHSSEASSSPRDDNSSSSTSGSHSTPLKTLNSSTERGGSPESFSALQRLQFALEKNSLFSNMYGHTRSTGRRGSSMSPTTRFVGGLKNDSNDEMLAEIPLGTPQSSDKSDGDPEEGYEHASADLNLDEHLVPAPTTSPNGSITNNPNIFQCPLCSVTCNSRHQFNEHLVSHSQQHACPKCSFLTGDEDALRSHLQDTHDVSGSEMVTDDEVRVPKMNSQGKMKTFKCKQCEYKAVTKQDFWEHSKSHIRQEKMLTCPKCPFVTEYKHHLEYHLRNHFNSKPFQCTKCPYSCVNKSMLNSHLKSHSNVYQYRCRDCSYATKYCHSLKLHLRKYSHNPSIVLNLDGTPNPLPIIDVYGTRRGPKIKRPDPTQQTTDYNSNNKISNTSTNLVKNELKKRCNNNINNKNDDDKPRGMKPELSTPPPSKKYSITSGSDHSDSEPESLSMRSMSHQIRHSMPETPVTPTSMGIQGLLQNSLVTNGSEQMQVAATAAAAAAAAAAVAGKNPWEFYAAINQYMLASNPLLQMVPPLNDLAKMAKEQNNQLLSQFMSQLPMMPQSQCASPPVMSASSFRLPQQQQQQQQSSGTPLSSSTSSNNNNQGGHTPLDLRNPKSSPNSFDSPNPTNETGEKRKRKGKAVRYDRAAVANIKREVEDENDFALDFSSNNNNNTVPGNIVKSSATTTNNKDSDDVNMRCKYCEISFPDKVLYSMHMSYHSGDGNPFHCKSCGKKTQDKISFFLHLTTDSH